VENILSAPSENITSIRNATFIVRPNKGNNYQDGNNSAVSFTDEHYPARIPLVNYDSGWLGSQH
jgi:hypothetical protein